jgi:hypothetical protein
MGGMPIVTLKEGVMTRLEPSAWPLAFGSACVFALAVVLDRLPWQVAFAAVILAVVVWAWQSPFVTGAALGGVAWMCVTGFDVHRLGDLRITGSGDVVRAAVLVLVGALVATAHGVAEGTRGRRRADPVPAESRATVPGHLPGERPVPRPRGPIGIEARRPVRPGKGAE